jgi:hypothetical protein
MIINEYIYVDVARVESYFLQVSDPVKYEKVPIWKVAFGISGPKVEGTQNQNGREFTQHEKIVKLAVCLSESKSNDFCLQRLKARRALLPLTITSQKDKSLAMWICWEEKYPGFGYLIEDYHNDDKKRSDWSGRTALQMLFSDIAMEQIEKSNTELTKNKEAAEWEFKLSSPAPKNYDERVNLINAYCIKHNILNHPLIIDTFSNHDDTFSCKATSDRKKFNIDMIGDVEYYNESARNTLKIERNLERELAYQFATTPFTLLKEWGATIAEEREIDVLYRIRDTMIESSVSGGQGAVIGYPIVIAASPSTLIADE